MRLLSLSVAAALGLTACLSDSAKSDPYAGMSCEQKIAAIGREIQADLASQAPAAKASARRTDTTQPDTAKPDTARMLIPVFRGFPPVAGLDSAPVRGLVVTDNRTDIVNPGSTHGVQWIAPVGFDSLALIPSPLPPASNLPGMVSALQIVAVEPYKAHVRIFDYRDALIREFDQDFGYRGEFGNPNRGVGRGLVSYLVWDGKDASGRAVSSGVYLWKVRLEMESKQVVEKTAKTGFIGEECRQAP